MLHNSIQHFQLSTHLFWALKCFNNVPNYSTMENISTIDQNTQKLEKAIRCITKTIQQLTPFYWSIMQNNSTNAKLFNNLQNTSKSRKLKDNKQTTINHALYIYIITKKWNLFVFHRVFLFVPTQGYVITQVKKLWPYECHEKIFFVQKF